MGDSRSVPALQGQQIPAWAGTVGPGWAPLLDQLHRDLFALDPGYRIESFAVKFGGLRITVADRFPDGEFDGEFADRTTALTDAAETASENACDECGAPGRIRLRGDGQRVWMQARCETCRTTVTSCPAPPRHSLGPLSQVHPKG
ncbi:hypothetical protein [Streptomyces sp. 8L]|uniref:hypothetical protein n=1 Tax=Streptomyces sp. 8L TaxID=2877242 RepID=UPI001CD2497F|nr:hypothetical protein [Streptomyces sp. 8L]MCA1221810.1 hypothetical protein [Streptomyces sp. 8L]